MRLTVIGTGYLGATHAAAMAELGHDVLGLDVDDLKVERLNAGEVPFFEPGLPELLATRSGQRSAAVHHLATRRWASSATSTSSASARRRRRASTPQT